MTLIEQLRFFGGVGDEAADLLEAKDARIAELEATIWYLKSIRDEELAVLRRKIDEAPVVAWMYENDGMVHDSMNPPLILMLRGKQQLQEEPFTETALISKEDLQK